MKKKKDNPSNKDIRKYAKKRAKEKRGDGRKKDLGIRSKGGYSFTVDQSKVVKPVSVRYRDLEERVKEWYDVMGEIDWDFDYFSLFTPALLNDVRMIFNSKLSNHDKANTLDELLERQGFIEVGTGTNITTFLHPDAPGVVYKIALDPCGVTDNRNDPKMAKLAPEAKPAIVVDMTKDAIISVQEYVCGIRKGADMMLYWNEALDICKSLSERFLVIDVTPCLYTNWAIGRNMELRTCDVSDLYPLDKGEDVMRCTAVVGENKKGELVRCGGRVYYDDNYQHCYCSRCGRNWLPVELKPRAKQWDPDEYISTGLTDLETKYSDRRAGHFIYYRNRAAERGLVATYVSTAQLTPLPDTYPTRPMSKQEREAYERKTERKIIPYTGSMPFRVDYPEEFADFSDNFYRKHGRIPGRIDKDDYLDLAKLLSLNPKLIETRDTLIIGDERVDVADYMPNNGALKSESEVSEPNPCVISYNSSESSPVDNPTNNNESDNTEDVERKYDELGMMIGSEQRKEYYRNIEAEPPLYDMVNGKKKFRSKTAQIIWCRGNVTPASFANTVKEKYNGDIDQMVETFERYYPDSRLDYYLPVVIPKCYLFGDDAEEDSVEQEKNEDGFTELKSQGLKDPKAALMSIYGKLKHAPVERSFADDEPHIATIPLDPVPSTGGAKLSPEFGTDIERVSKRDDADIRMAEKESSSMPSWATAEESKPKDNESIPVAEITAETEEVEMYMVDGETIALEFDSANVHDLQRFLNEKLPKITVSIDGGKTVGMTVSSKAMGTFLIPLIQHVVQFSQG